VSAAGEAASVRDWIAETAKAATAFERRWTLGALKRVDAGLAKRLRLQLDDFNEATLSGSESDVEKHGAATCRGYAAVVRAMEAAGAPDDAYLEGWCPRTGFRVAIANQRAAADRVVELHGRQVCFVTPDEVAAILSGLEGFKLIDVIKRQFPGAEALDFYPDEPAKGDSGLSPDQRNPHA
jgi:hypothetical protein